MAKKRFLASVLAAVMSVTLFASCGGNTGSSSSTGSSGSSSSSSGSSSTESKSESGSTSASTAVAGNPEADRPAGEVIINLGAEPPEMNSITTTSTGSMNVLRHIMDGLVYLDQQDAPVAAIAKDWTVSEDNKTYTFNLRDDAKWTNGDPVTANDFIFAWTKLFTAETAAQYGSTWGALILGATEYLNGTAPSEETAKALADGGYDKMGFKAIDDHTIQVTLTNPYPYFLSVLAFPNFYPMNEKAYNEIGAEAYGTDLECFVTNGAFKITAWEHESELVIEKNEDYYDAANINLNKITFAMIADTNAAMNGYKKGELDMIGLNGAQVEQLNGEGFGERIQSYDDASCWYFEFQTAQPGIKNAKVRKALTMAIDTDKFIKTVLKNNSVVANSFTPPAVANGEFTKAVGDLLNRPATGGDYSACKTLLDEGLAEEGMTAADLKISIITDEGDTAKNNAAFYQEEWKTKLGVMAEIEQMTYKARLDRMTQKDFTVVLAGWGPDYNDPMTFMDLWITDGGNNHTSWSNAEYDQYIKDAIKEPDPAKRQEILINAEKLLAEEMPVGYIYNRKRDYICNDRFKGIVRTGFDDLNLRWATAE